MGVKRGLMTQFPYARGRSVVCKNIGDYIQAVATRQFVDPVDEYIEQEEAYAYYPKDNRHIRLVMNGWFQWRAENWPPSEYIDPLLISMHISPLKTKELLNERGISFLRKNAPVGCRDLDTVRLLEAYGIPAYFSACMTLTLGEMYAVDQEEKNGVCIVDPFFPIPEIVGEKNGKRKINPKNAALGLWLIVKHLPVVAQLGRNPFFQKYSPTGFLDRSKSKIRPYYKAAVFYNIYRKKFSKDILLNAEYITHWIDVDMRADVGNDDLLDIAEGLVKKYSHAKLVITSRIHAALPCLGVETPVIFITNDEITSATGTFNTPGRTDGLIDLLRTINLNNKKLTTEDDILQGFDIIDMESCTFQNKRFWRYYSKELKRKVLNFMQSSGDMSNINE